MPRVLTAMQTSFVAHYVDCGNAREAVTLAGYASKKSADDLLGNDRVKAAVGRARSRLEAMTGVSKQALVDRLWKITESDDTDRVSAARELSKILGYYAPRRTELSGPNAGPITVATGKGASQQAEKAFDAVLGIPQPGDKVH